MTLKTVFNPFTQKLDIVGLTPADITTLSGLFLQLDQATIQHVINNPPQFDAGITIKANQKLYFDGQ